MSSNLVSYVTPEEYLERERSADEKHEYVFGEVVAKSGGTPEHALITLNLAVELRSRLAGRCRVFSPDLRVCVKWGAVITYPDVSVVCGTPQFTDDQRDTLTNPAFLAEVLSPSTKSFDRGEKSRWYRMLPSLNEYLLVDQTPVDIEHWKRLPNGNWELETIRDAGETIRSPLSGANCR